MRTAPSPPCATHLDLVSLLSCPQGMRMRVRVRAVEEFYFIVSSCRLAQKKRRGLARGRGHRRGPGTHAPARPPACLPPRPARLPACLPPHPAPPDSACPLQVGSASIRISGFISKLGFGRRSGDRQLFSLNSRPVDVPRSVFCEHGTPVVAQSRDRRSDRGRGAALCWFCATCTCFALAPSTPAVHCRLARVCNEVWRQYTSQQARLPASAVPRDHGTTEPNTARGQCEYEVWGHSNVPRYSSG